MCFIFAMLMLCFICPVLCPLWILLMIAGAINKK